jgi:creatinine amidohydrolase
LITTATSHDEHQRNAQIAVLPVGSFEQHGKHLPLATDSLIAHAIASRLAQDYDLFLLPPITIACSHEHADFAGTVSISSSTLQQIILDVQDSLRRSGIERLVLVNGHGGNYVLSNVVQESNARGQRMVLFPSSIEWNEARRSSGLVTDAHEDMHAGEGETSILLATYPDVVRSGYEHTNWTVEDRRHLLSQGIHAYAQSGVIGRPSLATATKGRKLLDALSQQFKPYQGQLS